MNIANEIKNYLKKYKLLNNSQHFLVGFSGGADSMLLLYLLNDLKKTYGYSISALHINHGWRGKESDIEAKNCEDFCKEYEINFYCEKLNKDIKKDENSARIARYQLFDKYSKKIKATAIFTAHNSTDSVETFLYRLSKGMGVEGAFSIPETRKGACCNIYRPLLSVSSQEIREKCNELGLKYNIDSSNSNNKYKRNFIRNEILPKFKELNPEFENSVLNFIENIKSNDKIMETFFEKAYKTAVKKNKITTSDFSKLSEDLKRKIIHKFLKDNSFEPDKDLILRVIKQIGLNKNTPNGKKYSIKAQNNGKNYFLFCSKKESYLVQKEENKKECTEFKKGFSSAIKVSQYKNQKIPKSSSKTAIVNKNSLNFPLTLRYRKNGDIIQPFSHKTTIKLKDYFIKQQIPQHKRSDIPLLCKGNEVLWAIGIGLSEKLRANFDCTDSCVVLKYNQED